MFRGDRGVMLTGSLEPGCFTSTGVPELREFLKGQRNEKQVVRTAAAPLKTRRDSRQIRVPGGGTSPGCGGSPSALGFSGVRSPSRPNLQAGRSFRTPSLLNPFAPF
jgi:hypothetical protein